MSPVKEIDKGEKKQIRKDADALQKCTSKMRVDKVTQAEIDNLRQAKTVLDSTSKNLLERW